MIHFVGCGDFSIWAAFDSVYHYNDVFRANVNCEFERIFGIASDLIGLYKRSFEIVQTIIKNARVPPQ
jgi:hypothetical protein